LSVAANRLGILAMLTSMTLFSMSDTLVKLATEDLPPGQIMAVRGVFAILFLLALVTVRGEGPSLRELRSPLVILRGLIEAAIAFLFITSLAQLPLANTNAILQATPIILTLLTVALGIEEVGWRRWIAIVVGFVGVLLIVKPSAGGMNVYALLALGSAALVAVRDLVTRRIKGHVPTSIITLATTVTVTLAGFALAASDTWIRPTGTHLLILAGAAFFVTLGSLAVVKAFRVGEIAVVSPFRYSVILTSLILGYLVFGDWPDAYSFLGIALIVGSGLYTLHREQVRQLEGTRRAATLSSAGETP
jgi:drug/metabolite transporter (DMT)-like permease